MGDNCDLKKSYRNEYIDFVKGIAIFLVLWGHVIQNFTYLPYESNDFWGNPVFKMIYSFHMPLFMILSGFVFYWSYAKRNTSDLFFYKIKSLLHPLLVWGGISFVINGINMNDFYNISNMIRQYCVEVFNIWFLWAILFCTCFTIIAEKFFVKSLSWMGYVIALGVACIVPKSHLVAFMLPYFVIGFLYNRYSNYLPAINVWG